jgi:chromosomal replication initiator protein
MRRDGIALSDEVVDFIALNVRESVRDLEGILASLLAHSTLTDKEIDLALAEKVVSHIVAVQPHRTTVEDVLEEVSKHYNIPQKALVAQNKSKEISQARHVAAYLSKMLTESSLTEIGYRMGRRTHATILHSVAYVKDQLEFDPVMRQHIAQLQSALQH